MTRPAMRTMSVDEFHAACKAQGCGRTDLVVLICPMCETPQTGAELVAAGAGADFDAVEKYFGFSCIGRWKERISAWSALKHARARKEGCDWTLGGLFALHTLEVITPDGQSHPRFAPATPEQAQAHLLAKGLS